MNTEFNFEPTPISAVPKRRSNAVSWFQFYASISCLMYCTLIAYAIGMMTLFRERMDLSLPDAVALASPLIIIGIICILLFSVSFFLPKRPLSWIYNFILIVLGLPVVCTLPFCIPLLYLWFQPDTRQQYGFEVK